jgi:hypothetical protein
MWDDKGYDLGLDCFAEFCKILKEGYCRGIILQIFAKFISWELIVCRLLLIFAKTIKFCTPPFLLHFRHSDPLECYWMINRNVYFFFWSYHALFTTNLSDNTISQNNTDKLL